MKMQHKAGIAISCRRSHNSLLLGFVVLCLLGSNRASASGDGKGRGEVQPEPQHDILPSRPVILLTGFDRFGDRKPPNPSWEGIARLDGQHWKGYQLVCKQMRVVWSAPREQLQQWISQYHPVAIFSFGEGGTGSIALESKASNKRGHGLDNENALPPNPLIVSDGPEEFLASIDVGELSRLLSQKGYQVRVSIRAGRYLCEEALYTLEYLKGKNKLETVSFCHVPPLGTHIGDKLVTPDYVEQFVKDMLEAWHHVYVLARVK
jgi:pyroglutamyl-peptidase